jgi:L-fuconolactonase
MEIIDTQVHVNRIADAWRTAEVDTLIDVATAAMDAVGVDAVLIAESWGSDEHGRPARATILPNGALRNEYPLSERAVARHPDRFAYLVRVDHRDPDLERLVAELRTHPGGLCLRVIPLPDTGDLDRFARGEFEPLFDAAARHHVPIFAAIPKRPDVLEPYLRAHPDLWVILDHCGVGVPPGADGKVPPGLTSLVTPTLGERLAELEHIFDLARRHPNLALKWCHGPARLSAEPYPHRDLVAHLQRAISAFGVERVMWASDYTESRTDQTWAQSLHYVLYSNQLSDTEKEWLLGRSARQVLRWS